MKNFQIFLDRNFTFGDWNIFCILWLIYFHFHESQMIYHIVHVLSSLHIFIYNIRFIFLCNLWFLLFEFPSRNFTENLFSILLIYLLPEISLSLSSPCLSPSLSLCLSFSLPSSLPPSFHIFTSTSLPLQQTHGVGFRMYGTVTMKRVCQIQSPMRGKMPKKW